MPKHVATASPPKADGTTSAESNKRAKISPSAADDSTEKTPFDRHWDALNAFQKDSNFLGSMLIKGISYDEEVDSDDEEATKAYHATLTTEQMADLRFVLITQNRSDQLDAMREYILGDQASDGLMFTTSFSYGIYDGFYSFKSDIYGKKRSWSEKFDLLFAYTYFLKQYDVWMHDNEGDMCDMVKDLASLWKRLLAKDDATLGIDSEYTRPGVLAMLQQFKDALGDLPDYNYTFKYN